jgi:hypothetical protein
LNYKILQVLEYSYIKKIDSKKIVNDCYEGINLDSSILIEKDGKFIANSSIGMLGKFKDKKEKSTIVTTEYDAQLLMKEHGGYYYKIINPNDNKDIIYFHVVKTYKRFKNGYLPLHMMIYDNMRITLNNIITDMEKLDIGIYGIKTDAIYFEDNRGDINTILIKYGMATKQLIDMFNKTINPDYNIIKNIGKLTFKYSVSNYDTIHGFKDFNDENIIKNKLVNYTKEFKRNKIEVENEYKITEIINKTILLSLNPGSGKSESCKKYIKNNNLNGLFVINNNNLGIEISKDGFTYITPHLLFNLNIEGNESEQKYIKKFDINEYDVIVFEEIFFNDLNILLKMYDLMINKTDKIYLANGDVEQLECKKYLIDEHKKVEFVNIMFPNYIELEIIKRCGCLSK